MFADYVTVTRQVLFTNVFSASQVFSDTFLALGRLTQ